MQQMYVFNTRFFNEYIIKWKFLKQYFYFFFASKIYFYIICISFLQQTKNFILDDFTNENNEDHNKKWSYVPYQLCRMLIIGGSGSGKTNALLSIIKE